MAMTPAEIAAERRRGRLAGIAAAAAALTFPAGVIWSGAVNSDRPEDNEPAKLRFYDRHAGELVGSTALRSIGFLLLIAVAVHLYRATKARSPELGRLPLVLGVLGPLAVALGTLGQSIYLAFASSDFVDREFQTIEAAEDVTTAPVSLVTVGLSIAGTLMLAFWFVAGSLYAMRVGLLSRFLGIAGILVGAGFVLGLPAVAFSSLWLFWLLAVGALFLGFQPRGLPPAWESGEARPWPSRADREESRSPADAGGGSPDAGGGSRNGDVEAVGPGVRRSEDQPTRPAAGAAAGKRRKRKRRR
jgi:hypothetical protein